MRKNIHDHILPVSLPFWIDVAESTLHAWSGGSLEVSAWPAETLVGPGVGTPLPVGTGGGPGYAGGSYGGPSTGPVYGALWNALTLLALHQSFLMSALAGCLPPLFPLIEFMTADDCTWKRLAPGIQPPAQRDLACPPHTASSASTASTPWLENLSSTVYGTHPLQCDGFSDRVLQKAHPLLLHSQAARMPLGPASLTFGCLAGPQLLQNSGVPERSLQTAKPVLYTLPDCLYTIPASKPCNGPSSVGCSIPGQCTDTQLPGGCCQIGFKCT